MTQYLLIYVLATVTMSMLCMSIMIGPGLYHVTHITKCDDTEGHLFIFDIQRRKYNRTHDGFNLTITQAKPIDSSYGIQVDICKHVDGGCKLYLVLRDDDIIHFWNEYAEDNLMKFLMLAGVDPPKFPTKAKIVSVTNFIFNYEELPDYGVYGNYEAYTVMLDSDKNVVGCIDMSIDFREIQFF